MIHKKTFILMTLLALLFSACSNSGKQQSAQDVAVGVIEERNFDWLPDGFEIEENFTQWGTKWESNNVCGSGRLCVTVTFVGEYECPNYFDATVNFLNEEKSIVAYDTVYLKSLRASQKATLKFYDDEQLGQSAEIGEINCG
jgi:hypothetical protein